MLLNALQALKYLRLTNIRVWHGRMVVWLAAIVAAGVIVGFTLLVDKGITVFDMLHRQSKWIPLVLTPIGAMVIVFLTRRFFKGSEGSGIPQVIAARSLPDTEIGEAGGLTSLRIAFGKIVLGAAALGCGFSMGREGPSVQVGASIMFAFRRWLPRRFPVHAQHLLVAGGAAGIAAAFNAPLAGVVFAIEELGRQFEERTNGVVLTAIVLAGAVAIPAEGNYTYFGRIMVAEINGQLALPIFVTGLLCGVLGGVFSRLMFEGSGTWGGPLGRFKSEYPVWFAGCCGLFVAVLGVSLHGVTFGSGYAVTRQALDGTGTLSFGFALAKMAATLVSYIAGIPGGIFAPSLAVGGGIGQGLAHLGFGHIATPVWMALSMAGFLAAVTQAPITSFVIVMEMVDGHSMVISLIATAFIASGTSRAFTRPLYHALAERMLANRRIEMNAQTPPTPTLELPQQQQPVV